MKASHLFLALLAASCASSGEKRSSVPMPEGISARIELESLSRGQAPSALRETVVLSDRELHEPGNRVISDEASDLLPGFLREARTSISARWIGDAPIAEAADRLRVLRLRRILTFEKPKRAKACFPRIEAGELSVSEDGRAQVVISEIVFSLRPSAEVGAVRVALDRVFVRRAECEIPRILPIQDKPLPAVLSLTLRTVQGQEEKTHTVLFAETIDLTRGDHVGGGQVSDWIPAPEGRQPHSVLVGAVAREELNTFAKTLRDAGLSIFDLTRTIKKAGML
jgi:hypothetical protein